MPVSPHQVPALVERWLARARPRSAPVQVGFFGGSFTGLAPDLQDRFLAAVQPFLAAGRVHSLRLSTRPDTVDRPTLARLRAAGVATVELGAQSLDPAVLRVSRRGHGVEEVVRAAALVRRAGIELGIQLMIGLPAETLASLRRTVARVAWIRSRLDAAGITVARMGLQSGPELEDALVAGPYHPAFGELVLSRLMLHRTRKLLLSLPRDRSCTLVINPRDLSLFYGQHGSNRERLTRLGLSDRFRLRTDPGLNRFSVRCVV